MKTSNKIIIGIAVVVVLFAGFISYKASLPLGSGAGQSDFFTHYFLSGYEVGATQNNTVINAFSCATATWNPGSVATSTINNATTTDIALTGAVAGDLCSGSLSSATSTAIAVDCNISGAGTSTLQITNLGVTNAAIDLATGTAKVCFTH